MKTEKRTAIYVDLGKIELETGEILNWDQLELPYGSQLEVVINYEEVDYLSGLNGIVWATQNSDQAETIKGALDAQGIFVEVIETSQVGTTSHLLRVADGSRIERAIDYIWRSDEGLKLQPDWHYPAGAANASFERWTKAI